MILITELIPIGTAVKTHGLRGELSVELDSDFATEELEHVVLRVDGIFVPFRITSQRPRGSRGLLLSLAGVESADEASAYTGHEIYALRRELPDVDADDDTDEGLYAEDLEGFMLTGPNGREIGKITDVDTTTINTLLHVGLDNGHTALIPLAEEWICSIDAATRTIAMDVPAELLTTL